MQNKFTYNTNEGHAFGSSMAGRSFNNSGYRYGFNTQEKTDEIAGEGNHTTALFWEYDTRLGRRWNLDPKPQTNISDYACFGNNPILMKDLLGDEKSSTHLDPDGKVIAIYNDGDKGVYKHQTAKTKKEVDNWRKKFNNTSGNGIKIAETLNALDFAKTNDKTGGYKLNEVPEISIDLKKIFITGTITPSEGKEETIYNADAPRLINWVNTIFKQEADNLIFSYSLLKKLSYMSGNYSSSDPESKNGKGSLDIKNSLGLNSYSPISYGKTNEGLPLITTLRACGNIAFGSNILNCKPPAVTKSFFYETVMKKVGSYNQKQNGGNGYNSSYPYYGEHSYSGNYIFFGYWGKFYE